MPAEPGGGGGVPAEPDGWGLVPAEPGRGWGAWCQLDLMVGGGGCQLNLVVGGGGGGEGVPAEPDSWELLRAELDEQFMGSEAHCHHRVYLAINHLIYSHGIVNM